MGVVYFGIVHFGKWLLTHLFNMDKKYMYCGTYINIILFIIN